ncbi:MAG: hypothetical protein JWP03_4630 [Phycisphaerales bacterium]|nr:hypothetical protein [Phycisphaerales bacterium]
MRNPIPFLVAFLSLCPIARPAPAQESPLPQGWEYADAMRAVAAKGHARPGVVIHIGDSITCANP